MKELVEPTPFPERKATLPAALEASRGRSTGVVERSM